MSRLSRLVRIAVALGLLLALGLLGACASQVSADSEPAAPSTSSASGSTPPTVKITSPAAGETLPAGTIQVAVETTGIEFVMPSGTNVAGQGHVHFTLDDRPFEMSIEKTAEIKDVGPGTHRLVAELVQNNTDPLDPPVTEEIEFVVK